MRLTPEMIAFGVCVVVLGSAAAPPATPEVASAEVSYAWPTCVPHNMGMCRHPKSCQEQQVLAVHLPCSLQHSGNTLFFFFFLQKVSPKSSVLIFYLFTVLRRPKLVLSMKLHQSAGQWEPFPGVLWLKITPFGGEDPGSLFVFMSSVNLI